MRRFLIELLRFSLVLILVLAVPMGYSRYLTWKRLEKESHLPKQVTILATGDSHVECAISPKYLPGCENIGLSSQRMAESLSKLRYYCNDSNSIGMVILSLNHYRLIRNTDEEDGLFSQERKRTFAQRFAVLECYLGNSSFKESILAIMEDSLKMDHNPFLKEQMLKERIGLLDQYRFKRLMRLLIDSDYSFDFRGGFLDQDIRNLSKANLQDKLDSHFGTDRDSKSLAGNIDQCEYQQLQEIVAFCQERDIQLVLYNAPVHSSYLKGLSPTFVASIDSMLHDFAVRHQVTYIDHSRFALPDSCMRDYDHTNIYGARIATQALKDSLDRLFVWENHRFFTRKSAPKSIRTVVGNAVRVQCEQ